MNLRVGTSYWCALVLLAAGLVPNFAAWAADAAGFDADYVPTVLITGSNRGIGFEFVRQYSKRGWHVIATTRSPDKALALKELAGVNNNIIIEQLDVTDFDRIDELAAKYIDTPIDLLLNNAGISGGSRKQMFTKMDFGVFARVLAINSIAPLKITEAFYPHVRASRDKKIVTISSSEGVISGVTRPSLYFLRSSKAAVNLAMVNLALQLKYEGISVAMVNPGPTDTDLMADLPKKMLRPAPDSVADMIRNIDQLTLDNSGVLINPDGSIVPW
jgi:NAD(P)-dependent dehydrogenase (short-subunit alcohol dehydrogenase family)